MSDTQYQRYLERHRADRGGDDERDRVLELALDENTRLLEVLQRQQAVLEDTRNTRDDFASLCRQLASGFRTALAMLAKDQGRC